MNIILIGSGGREHALAVKIKESKLVDKLYILPGNAGTASVGINVDISSDNFKKIANFAVAKQVKMIVVGTEIPLANGFHDYFFENKKYKHIKIIGPKKDGAKIESSKDFAKKFMLKYNIPTAKYITVSEINKEEGKKFMHSLNQPYVLKADGLAAGKGVLIIDDINDAEKALDEMLDGKFGKASNKVIIEEFLSGNELSVFVLTDGKNYKILPEAKDYKRIGEADTGLNTGGMGAVSPVPFANKEFLKKVENQIIIPTINGLNNEKIDYKGFIFFGLISVNNKPFVIEYNVRAGDPETEVIIPRIESDIVELFLGVSNGTLNEKQIKISPKTAVTVMLVSAGYPEAYSKGKIIKNINKITDSIVFHAGTKYIGNEIITNGGRVIAITSLGNSIEEALKKSYKNAEIIDFEGKNYRNDIGFDLNNKY